MSKGSTYSNVKNENQADHIERKVQNYFNKQTRYFLYLSFFMSFG